MLDQSYYKKADEILDSYPKQGSSLIPIIQDIQSEFRYIPPELLAYVAKKIGIFALKQGRTASRVFTRIFPLSLKGNM